MIEVKTYDLDKWQNDSILGKTYTNKKRLTLRNVTDILYRG